MRTRYWEKDPARLRISRSLKNEPGFVEQNPSVSGLLAYGWHSQQVIRAIYLQWVAGNPYPRPDVHGGDHEFHRRHQVKYKLLAAARSITRNLAGLSVVFRI